MSQKQRIFAGIIVFVLSTVLSYDGLAQRGVEASDFSWPLRAAERVSDGESPYTDPRDSDPSKGEAAKPYPYDAPFYYPIHAAIVALPFTVFSDRYLAGSLFFGVGAGLLAYGILKRREDWHRLALFGSANFWVAAVVAQWSPLIMAAAFIPALLILTPAKPNLGLAVVAGNGLQNRNWVIATGAVVVLSVVLFPYWPREWRENITDTGRYFAAYELGLGILLLLSVLRFKEYGARVLLTLSLIPQLLWFYDTLLLWLTTSSWRSSLSLTGLSWVAWFLWSPNSSSVPAVADGPHVVDAAPIIVAFLYMPALIMVLRPWDVVRQLRRTFTRSPNMSPLIPTSDAT